MVKYLVTLIAYALIYIPSLVLQLGKLSFKRCSSGKECTFCLVFKASEREEERGETATA